MEGQYCQLDPLRAKDHAEPLFAAFEDDEKGDTWHYLAEGPFASLEEYRQWVSSTETISDQLFWAITDLDTGQVSGILSYLRIQPGAGSIEIGTITYSPHLRRCRAGSEAIILLIRTAFALGYRRVEWKCNALNEPSRRAALRYGFTYEGTFRQALVVKGRNRDTAWFSIIDREFPPIDASYGQWLNPGNFDEQGKQIVALSALVAGRGIAE